MAQKQTSKPAKILYRPIGLASGVIGGVIAGQVFKQVWKHAAPGDRDEAPKSLSTGYALKEILIAAAIQGAIFAVIKTVLDRGGARLFERWTGEWPGE
ncbi:DUF4235 domain-containing protein [Arthrobacter sp. ISL-65]|uniref:DUF4235 domain-containing protein n=1 Tax=Arthrobacter sp. ISL-65 TaxID=2819112 RepID=UPI001BE7E789|nr:DUF4235 domain-containing protein [Arthrobacter sp. ISL-65]MBT2551326.1 DUF4235 domain-containing protein [Arthrobacter sp. ISL-65]